MGMVRPSCGQVLRECDIAETLLPIGNGSLQHTLQELSEIFNGRDHASHLARYSTFSCRDGLPTPGLIREGSSPVASSDGR